MDAIHRDDVSFSQEPGHKAIHRSLRQGSGQFPAAWRPPRPLVDFLPGESAWTDMIIRR
jgi:hypothetical protein